MRIRIAPFPIIVVGTVDLSTYKAGCMYDRKMWACTDVPYTHAYVYGRLYKRMHSHYYGSIVKVSVLFRSASFIRVYQEIISIKKKYTGRGTLYKR